MGKIRYSKKKLHASAPKVPQTDAEVSAPHFGEYDVPMISTSPGNLPSFSGVNIFKNVEIPSHFFKQKLEPDFDAKSIISSISTQRNVTKKEKREIRHKTFLQKLEARKATEEKIKEEKKRRQTPIVGDLKPLSDALPMLDYLFKKTKEKEPLQEKPFGSQTLKQKQASMLKDLQTFQQIQQDSSFKADPFAAMSSHIKLLLESKKI